MQFSERSLHVFDFMFLSSLIHKSFVNFGRKAYSCGWKKGKQLWPSKEDCNRWAGCGDTRRKELLEQLCNAGVHAAIKIRGT